MKTAEVCVGIYFTANISTATIIINKRGWWCRRFVGSLLSSWLCSSNESTDQWQLPDRERSESTTQQFHLNSCCQHFPVPASSAPSPGVCANDVIIKFMKFTRAITGARSQSTELLSYWAIECPSAVINIGRYLNAKYLFAPSKLGGVSSYL